MADESGQDRMETEVGAGAEEEGPLVAMARQFELQMNEIIGLIAAPDRPQPLEEKLADFVELGRRLRSEFERVHDEETTGDRRTALSREIAELEATVAAKDALLERYALKVGQWDESFARLAREHEDTERHLSPVL